MSKYQTRKLINYFNLVASLVVTALGLFMLAWILSVLFSKGFQYINWAVFTQMTPPPGSAGGLLNAIFGTLVITFFAVLIGTPIGIMAGTYLSEFGGNSRFSSGWAGAIALAILVIPVVVRTTEDMLKLVPVQLREAAAALGAPRYTVTLSIVYKAALSGMITGVLLATARIMGETAPLLFTALNNQFWSSNMNEPIANMPVVIYQYALSPYEDWQNLAWAAALLITLSVLTMNIIARYTLKGSSSR
ncbi:MAG: phosphate ABC transporter, permease protein PstA [Halothiobacillus sp. 20-53-49]|nr:MAG: phosphate ABC transporter, permease protein PstA [Halothiobacillus sp. 20-53-49]